MTNNWLIRYLEINNNRISVRFQKTKKPYQSQSEIESSIHEVFNKQEHLTAIFFDIEKACDTTWRHGIKKDLKDLGLMDRMPILICNFLDDQHFNVRINDALSIKKKQGMGMPQGSILLVTLLHKNKWHSENIKTRTNCALYVNDFLIYCKSKHMHTMEHQFQFCLDRLDRWTTETGFKFSKDKTKCIYFCQIRKMHNEPTLELGQILWSKNTNIWASILNSEW